jgi:hypothetical protein
VHTQRPSRFAHVQKFSGCHRGRTIALVGVFVEYVDYVHPTLSANLCQLLEWRAVLVSSRARTREA